MSDGPIEQLVAEAVSEALDSPEGSFWILASRSSPERYVQWMTTGAGLHVEVANTDANHDMPMTAAQLETIAELGFEDDAPNFSCDFDSQEEAIPPVVRALVDVFAITAPSEVQVTNQIEGEGQSLRSTPTGVSTPAPQYVEAEDLSWFRSLAEVPGIKWEPPDGVAVGPPLSNARPLVKEYGGDPPLTVVEWLDEAGDPLPDESGFGSPADRAGRGIYQAQGTHDVVQRVSTALSLPGTKDEYFRVIEQGISALGQQDDEDPARVRSRESLARLGIALIENGLEEALVPPFGRSDRDRYLGSAASPYSTLIQLYQREGFLREARAVFAALQALPEEARGRAYIGSDPGESLAALEELANSEGSPR